MNKSTKKGPLNKRVGDLAGYSTALIEIVELLEAARRTSARSVNTIITATYWEIGRRIVEIEQKGQSRADYGKQVVEQLAIDLTARLGRGFGRRNLFQMRSFYLTYSDIVQTLSAQSESHSVAGRPWLASGNSQKFVNKLSCTLATMPYCVE